MKATLTYHSIDESGSPISVSLRAFSEHARWLTSGGVRALTLDQLVADPDDGRDAVAVTFDDGIATAKEPIRRLLDAGVPVTVFVVTGRVGATNAWDGREDPIVPTLPLMTWTDLEDLTERGASIGAHGRTHRALVGLSASALEDELLGSREDLRARLGSVPHHVAYPFGGADAHVAACAQRFFSWGHTTEFRLHGATSDAMRQPRLDMYYFNARRATARWGSGSFRRRVAAIRVRRTIGAWVRAR